MARLDDVAECTRLSGLAAHRNIPWNRKTQWLGYRGISLVKRELENEVEFATIMWFDSIDAIKVFAGEHDEIAVVPPKARAVLSRFDTVSAHYDTVVVPCGIAGAPD